MNFDFGRVALLSIKQSKQITLKGDLFVSQIFPLQLGNFVKRVFRNTTYFSRKHNQEIFPAMRRNVLVFKKIRVCGWDYSSWENLFILNLVSSFFGNQCVQKFNMILHFLLVISKIKEFENAGFLLVLKSKIQDFDRLWHSKLVNFSRQKEKIVWFFKPFWQQKHQNTYFAIFTFYGTYKK